MPEETPVQSPALTSPAETPAGGSPARNSPVREEPAQQVPGLDPESPIVIESELGGSAGEEQEDRPQEEVLREALDELAGVLDEKEALEKSLGLAKENTTKVEEWGNRFKLAFEQQGEELRQEKTKILQLESEITTLKKNQGETIPANEVQRLMDELSSLKEVTRLEQRSRYALEREAQKADDKLTEEIAGITEIAGSLSNVAKALEKARLKLDPQVVERLRRQEGRVGGRQRVTPRPTGEQRRTDEPPRARTGEQPNRARERIEQRPAGGQPRLRVGLAPSEERGRVHPAETTTSVRTRPSSEEQLQSLKRRRSLEHERAAKQAEEERRKAIRAGKRPMELREPQQQTRVIIAPQGQSTSRPQRGVEIVHRLDEDERRAQEDEPRPVRNEPYWRQTSPPLSLGPFDEEEEDTVREVGVAPLSDPTRGESRARPMQAPQGSVSCVVCSSKQVRIIHVFRCGIHGTCRGHRDDLSRAQQRAQYIEDNLDTPGYEPKSLLDFRARRFDEDGPCPMCSKGGRKSLRTELRELARARKTGTLDVWKRLPQ